MSKEFDIPQEIDITLYTTICIEDKWEHNIGEISTTEHNRAEIYKDDVTESHVLLAETPITIPLGKVDIDINGKILRHLHAKKAKVQADYVVDIELIQNRIDNLLAIEYSPKEEAA